MADPYKIKIDPTLTNDPAGRGAASSNFVETAEGDLVLGADGDIVVAGPKQAEIQKAIYTVHTSRNTCILYPKVGATLRSFRGWTMTEAVFSSMEESLEKDLAKDGVRLVPGSVEVNPLDEQNGKLLVSFTLALKDGQNTPINYLFDVDGGDIELLGGGQI